MKKIYLLLNLLSVSLLIAQAGAPAAYYNGFNWTQTGTTLKNALATKITTTHVDNLTYSQLWNALSIIDEDPNNSNNIISIYSWNSTGSIAKSNQCGGSNCNNTWNREHTYVQSLGTPDLGSTGPGADAHHMRACQYQLNESRGSRKYTAGSGNAGTVGSFWYPGDQWKGDVARMMMYMYLRYPTRCLPTNIGTGATVGSDSNMLQLFLQWNAEDPISPIEDFRNTYLGNANNAYGQGNRNPFIDNPYLATVIWGGPVAENRWPNIFLSTDQYELVNLSVYPNPTNTDRINIESPVQLDEIVLINVNGQLMQQIAKPAAIDNTYTITNMKPGFYIVKITSADQTVTKKIIVN